MLAIGAITDVASAILRDPSITSRIRVPTWGQRHGRTAALSSMSLVVLACSMPLVVGSGDVSEYLSLSLDQARGMVAHVGKWLWTNSRAWYYRFVKPIRKNDFSKPWVIWDTIVSAHLLSIFRYARPVTLIRRLP